MSTIRAAVVQLRTPATLDAALAHAEPLVREAAARGATLIVTPEAANIVQKDRAKLAEQITSLDRDPVVQGLARLAGELKVQLVIGSALVRREDGGFANRSVLVGPDGTVQASYDKIHMFDVDLPNGERYRESSVYVPGERAVLAPTPLGPLGLTVCYDMRFPELYRSLARAGAVAMAVPAAFTRPTGEAHWETLLRARAIETGAYVLAAAQGGFHEDGRGTWGRSLIVGPWGDILARSDDDEPGVFIADLDSEAVAKARAAIPALANERAFAAPSLGAP
ncbi:MAG TPA: carbon-nitrogen hydrolase family protein [Caulobacteraceae bacterium]|jgi:predicted amidohydrolase|nr:carbon-nitrogen hydrolase family protein [Caulobacteraceae bacterium]